MVSNIYNSRNYSILLNNMNATVLTRIYNSRNYSILLNMENGDMKFINL